MKERLGEVRKGLVKTLEFSSDAPGLDAERIILHVLQKRDASYLIAHGDTILSEQQISDITQMAEQRKTGMPLAYILGETDFYGRTFIVTPDVLIPRPDTELLIEKTLEYIQKNFKNKKEITIADIGTGSGCIAITLALEIDKLTKLQAMPADLVGNEAKIAYRFIATDISPAALAVAKQNAEKHGVLDCIEFIQGDMLDAFSPPYQGGARGGQSSNIDLIVSNPPYIPTQELDELAATFPPPPRHQAGLPLIQGGEIRRGLLFEPRIALDGGSDGLQFVNQIKQSGIPSIIETVGGEIIETF